MDKKNPLVFLILFFKTSSEQLAKANKFSQKQSVSTVAANILYKATPVYKDNHSFDFAAFTESNQLE